MFDANANSNVVSMWGYLIVAIILALIDRPLGAIAMVICASTCAICCAIYRTAGKR